MKKKLEKIRIINSYEEYFQNEKNYNKKYKKEFEKEKEIKDNCEIYINNNKIEFSYFYEFKNTGKYVIKYSFLKYLANINYMFYDCSSLNNLNLSNFKTQNVNNMNHMFFRCSSLINIDFSNFNNQNDINMSGIFSECSSLNNLNLSNFKTQNVINMEYFFKCL